MTINEVRLDLYNQGFTLTERIFNDKVHIFLCKVDTDTLRFDNNIFVERGIMYEAGDKSYIDLLKDMTKVINDAITERHAQNPSNCTHQEVMIGSKKGCIKCMAKFGERMQLDFNWN